MRESRTFGAVISVVSLCAGLAGCGGGGDVGTTPTSTAFSLSCTVTPTSGTAPLRVALSTRITPFVPVSMVISYGDGTSGTDPNAAHTYSTAGSFNLAVSATSASQTNACQSTVTVLAPPPTPPNRAPIPSFHTTPSPAVGPAPLDVGLNLCQSVDPDGDRMSFKFDFGDGTRSTPGCRDHHVYAQGTYLAKACVTDGLPGHEVCVTANINAQ